MNTITKCNAYKIKDSRGEDTLEVEISGGGQTAWASVPSGKSTGSREAVALSVDEAIRNIDEIIAPQLINKKINFIEIDRLLLYLDGTEDKSNLGANAILGVSIAVLKLEAKIQNQPLWKYIHLIATWKPGFQVNLPRFFVNVLNGGVHADFRLPFQEYMFIVKPVDGIAEAIEKIQNLFVKLEEKLKKENYPFIMGDEGGFSVESTDIKEPFRILGDLHNNLAIDVAAGEFFENGKYNIFGQEYSSEELTEVYKNLIKEFPLKSIEDPFAENDFDGFKDLVIGLPSDEVLVVGDDLTTTNPEMIKKAIDKKMINTVLIKPNQIGTVSETLEAIRLSHQAGLKTIISHRSGETMDSFIADLAIGVGAYGVKFGTLFQEERKEKYKRLIEIEKEMAE